MRVEKSGLPLTFRWQLRNFPITTATAAATAAAAASNIAAAPAPTRTLLFLLHQHWAILTFGQSESSKSYCPHCPKIEPTSRRDFNR